MDITPVLPQGKQLITGYGGGGFKINQRFIAGSLLVCAEKTMPWNIGEAAHITWESLRLLLDAMPIELLLIGTGKSIHPIDPAIHTALKAKKIAFDVMDSGAACRTYNVLLGEARQVGAAVIAI